MSAPILEMKNLSVELETDVGRVPVLRDVSLSIKAGEVLSLVGESGSGKTVTAMTIMRLLSNAFEITGGELLLRGKDGVVVDIAAMSARDRRLTALRGDAVAMIFQEPMSSFSPLLRIGDQVGEVLRYHRGMSRAASRARVAELFDMVGIADPERAVVQYPHEFSGGMRQRAMIAKALACDPTLLIADEPTTALDVTIQAQILKLLEDLQQKIGLATLFITHDLGVVAEISDNVAIMYTGQIVETGTVYEVFDDPKHPYTRNLLRAIPRLGDFGAQIDPIQGNVPPLYDLPTGCTFHPRCGADQTDHCPRVAPATTDFSPTHRAACHLCGASSDTNTAKIA